MGFEDHVRGLMRPIRSRWLRMPSGRNRERMVRHATKALQHLQVYRLYTDAGHNRRATKHLRVAIAHLTRGMYRAEGEHRRNS